MDSKLFGGILLVVGTAIGAGMLALPIVNSQTGFLYSTILLVLCWFIMTASAFLLLEANLWLESNSNIISMAQTTLGVFGQITAWLCYLLLLYALLAAYIAGGSDFLQSLLENFNVHLNSWLTTFIFIALLSSIVYHGIRSVDYVNRGLMISKFGTLLVLLIVILPFISKHNLEIKNFHYFTSSATVALTSFGFANIIPSLRAYFHSDVSKIRKAIWIGSVIPLFCYILWDLAIMGTIPAQGKDGLIQMTGSGHTTSDFITALSFELKRPVITSLAHIFTSICLATSFLAVALCMTDFLADGLQIKKQGSGKIIIYLATFLPPLVIVFFYPGAFIIGLKYAGLLCLILFVILPCLMVWRGRYSLSLGNTQHIFGGKTLLFILLISSFYLIANELYNLFIH